MRPQLVLSCPGRWSVEAMVERNRRDFLCNLSKPDQQAVLQGLRQRYQVLLKVYLGQGDAVDETLEQVVSIAFSADVPAQLLVKIHVQVMDQLATQLRIEGHSTAFLKDYRLALIEVMARLNERYRHAMALGPSSPHPTRSPETAR